MVLFTYTMQLVGLEEEDTALACLPNSKKYKKTIIIIIKESKTQKMTEKKKNHNECSCKNAEILSGKMERSIKNTNKIEGLNQETAARYWPHKP